MLLDCIESQAGKLKRPTRLDADVSNNIPINLPEVSRQLRYLYPHKMASSSGKEAAMFIIAITA